MGCAWAEVGQKGRGAGVTVCKLYAVDLYSRMKYADTGPVQISVLLCKVVNVEPDQAPVGHARRLARDWLSMLVASATT